MWDTNILPFAEGYRDFMSEMHRLGARMIDESPYTSADELEQGMQAHLGYAGRKPLAQVPRRVQLVRHARCRSRHPPRLTAITSSAPTSRQGRVAASRTRGGAP